MHGQAPAVQTEDIAYIKTRISDHTERDSFDSYCVFQYKIIRAIRLYGEHSREAKAMELMAIIHFEKMTAEFFAKEKSSLSIVTSVDLWQHGESLCKPVLRE